ncbi:carbohydrate binding family 9 domain-containing protein [Pollutibacter soli]|uniref:carbohydrate binding family 9 domain-containing protein n=1 Tax=Pollutibacter soli TaxID=3034157 RepID=UPI0030136AB3
MRKRRLLLLGFLFAFADVDAQPVVSMQERFRMHIRKATGLIKLDGIFDEDSWQQATATQRFFEKWPNDVDSAKQLTEIRMTYDQRNLYFSIVAWQNKSIIVQTLKRDNGIYDSDAVSISLDPFNQKTNGFLFSINPYNVQTEDLISINTGEGNLNFSWDNKWYSATKRYEDRWTAEIAIPFSTLRFSADKAIWGINFLRSDLQNNQYSSWTDMPVNFPFFDFGYTGALIWDEPPPSPGRNISLIPYISGSAAFADNELTNSKLGLGVDAKIAITPSMNLDLTVNPDFSQVEVDRQVTNLTRFNIFFPERRTFFLENDDLFSGYGIDPIKPFYSRRIGLDNEGNTIPIAGGVRLSGNVTKKFRLGVMNMQSLKKGNFQAQNYTAVSFNQQVQKRSVVKGYFLNRQQISHDEYIKSNPLDEFGRNFGLEYNFIDITGKWNAWTGYHRSFKPDIKTHEHFIDLGFGYLGKKFNSVFDYTDLTNNYYTDMGYIERIENYDALKDTIYRVGFRHLFNETTYRIFPSSGFVNNHRFGMENYIVWNRDNTLNERTTEMSYLVEFKNTMGLRFVFNNTQTNLLFPTNVTDNAPLMPGKYLYNRVGLEFQSDYRKKIYFGVEGVAGGFYSGEMYQLAVSGTFRAQPWGNFSLDLVYSSLHFAEPTGDDKLLLIAPRIEINFTNNLFWTTFIQYNSQRNNINFNSRLQWRYKPMSDIFLVYTDNYFTDPLFKNKNRAVVFKMNYWLNL